jgi:hypothetical protein
LNSPPFGFGLDEMDSEYDDFPVMNSDLIRAKGIADRRRKRSRMSAVKKSSFYPMEMRYG